MKAAAYIRVSTDKVEQSESLENQKQQFLHFIKERSYDLYDFYVDVESGTTDKREGLKKLIEDAQKGLFDTIISKELSRLARNGELSYSIKRIAENNNVDIITMDGAVDTTDPSKQNMFGLYAWVYEQESQRTSDRIKSVLSTKAKNGKFMGSHPPYGYEVNDGKLSPRNDETVEVVKFIYQKFLEGWGSDKISRSLDKKSYPTPAQIANKSNAGKFWQGSSVRLILSNQAYKGDLVQHKETTISVTNKKRRKVPKDEQIIVPNAHPAIISQEDWETVQSILEKRKTDKSIRKGENHLFTGFLKCGDCGKGMNYRQNRKGYICGGHAKHGKIACTTHIIKEDVLKQIILNDFKSMSQSLGQDDILNKVQSKANKLEKEVNKKLSRIENKLETLKSRRNRYIDLLADEIISKQDYDSKVEEAQNEVKSLEIEKMSLIDSLNKVNDIDKLQVLKKELDKLLQFEDLTKEMLNRFIDKIEVEADGTPRIHYKFAPPVGF